MLGSFTADRMYSAGRIELDFRFSPIADSFLIPLRKPGVWVMQRFVIPKRHLAAGHHFADGDETVVTLLGRVTSPTRKVHVLARTVDVGGHQPQEGCDSAVPGPMRQFGVTIPTSPM